MNPKTSKQALKFYQDSGGNFRTGLGMPLKKESDLTSFYYPGIDAVLEKIQKSPESQSKYCVHPRTIGLISTRPSSFYPLLTARAALLSHLAGVNAIPLLVRYENVTNLPNIIEQLSPNFQMVIGTDLKRIEKEILRDAYREKNYPLYFTDQLEAAAVLSSLHSAAKMLKKSLKKAKVTIEGDTNLIEEILLLLKSEGADTITLMDEKGPLYEKRPNMNRNKNKLAHLLGLKKDSRTREEVLAATDLYITATKDEVGSSVTSHLPDNAVIVSLKSHSVNKKSKQSLISSLPHLPNHVTDLHIAVGLASAVKEGKKIKPNSLSQAIKGLHKVFGSAKQNQLIAGLFEKNLGKKIAKML